MRYTTHEYPRWSQTLTRMCAPRTCSPQAAQIVSPALYSRARDGWGQVGAKRDRTPLLEWCYVFASSHRMLTPVSPPTALPAELVEVPTEAAIKMIATMSTPSPTSPANSLTYIRCSW